MMKLSISDAKKIIKKCVEHTFENPKSHEIRINHTPAYLHSSPGLGKSSIIKQIALELNIGFVDVRLSQMEQSDVAGIPYVSHAGKETETMNISIPTWFPSIDKIKEGLFPEKGILFFDELSNAPIGVQHAAYGVILDRMVHGIKLGEKWQIIAAGNLKTDKTGAKGVAPALANRFGMHIEIKPVLEDLSAYAIRNDWNPQIIGFLNFKTEAMYQFDPSKNDVAFPTPRSWEMVNTHLKRGYTKSELAAVLQGCVGAATATDFMMFQKFYLKLPNFEKIMSGKETYKIPKKDMGLIFAVSSSIIAAFIGNVSSTNEEATKKEITKIKNLEKLMKQLDDDFLVLIYKSLKNGAESFVVSKIVVATMDTFKRVAEYIKPDEEEE